MIYEGINGGIGVTDIGDFKTCGEISCDECNDRYEKSLELIQRLESKNKQMQIAIDEYMNRKNGLLNEARKLKKENYRLKERIYCDEIKLDMRK